MGRADGQPLAIGNWHLAHAGDQILIAKCYLLLNTEARELANDTAIFGDGGTKDGLETVGPVYAAG